MTPVNLFIVNNETPNNIHNIKREQLLQVKGTIIVVFNIYLSKSLKYIIL